MRTTLLLTTWLLVSAPPAQAQADKCRSAVSALNRVKEELRPELSRERLELMHSTLMDASNACKSETAFESELFFMRAKLAERLMMPAAAVKSKQDKLLHDRYQKDYAWSMKEFEKSGGRPLADPFSAPAPRVTPAAKETDGKVARKWALVVGIDEFRDAQISRLNYAVKDSTDFVNYLKDPKRGRFAPDRIRHLTNGTATLAGIREGIGWLREHVQPEDLVVLFFSSHGSPRDIDPNGVSYIMTHDADLASPAKLYATSLQMIDLAQSLNREIKASRVILILDTCYSGDATTGNTQAGAKSIRPLWNTAPPPADSPASDAFSAALRTVKMGAGRAVITASRANEKSWENGQFQNGYFTHYLIEALSTSNGAMPIGDVFRSVHDRVLAAVQEKHNQTQTPTAEFNDRAASIVIGVPESN